MADGRNDPAMDRFAVPLLWGLTLLTFLFMLFVSWQRWADIIVDFGRELYVPWQISEGKLLYRDIFYPYGPFAAYWNAALLRTIGDHARTLAGFGFVLLGTVGWLVWMLASKLAGRLTVAFILFSYVSLFALAHHSFIANYNFVCPYSYALAYGLVMAFGILLLWKRYLRIPNPIIPFAVGVLLGLSLLTKLETAFAIWSAMAVGMVAWLASGRPGRGELPRMGLLAAGVALPVLVAFCFFSSQMGARDALFALASPFAASFNQSVAASPFMLTISGFDNVAGNLLRLCLVTLIYLAVAAAALAACFVVARVKGVLLQRISRIAVVTVFLGGFYFLSRIVDWNVLFVPLPLFCLIFIGFSLASFWKIDRETALLRLAFGIFALALMTKMPLKAHIFHYGFVLALPGFMAMLILFLEDVPYSMPAAWLDRRTFQVIMGSLLIFVCCVHMGISSRLYGWMRWPIDTARGKFMVYDRNLTPLGPVLRETIDYLKTAMRPGETLLVVPEGVMLNFLLHAPNPTPYYDFAPPVVSLVGEGTILQALVKTPPDYVLLLERDMSEYGPRYFGRDYCGNIFAWINANYKVQHAVGRSPLSGKGFGALILHRSE